MRMIVVTPHKQMINILNKCEKLVVGKAVAIAAHWHVEATVSKQYNVVLTIKHESEIA